MYKQTGGKTTQYLYDNAGNRFIKIGSNGTTLYLRHGQTAVAMDIEIPPGQAGVKGKINRYVLSGELLAGRITTTVKTDGSKSYEFSYYHLDHLNSTKCVSDSDGKVAVRYIYRAFGSQLAKIGDGEAKYTYGGKELDDSTNLYYFGARYYDAEIGRFISEDPAKDGLNWYGYANDNPLKFVDPTGLESYDNILSISKNDAPFKNKYGLGTQTIITKQVEIVDTKKDKVLVTGTITTINIKIANKNGTEYTSHTTTIDLNYNSWGALQYNSDKNKADQSYIILTKLRSKVDVPATSYVDKGMKIASDFFPSIQAGHLTEVTSSSTLSTKAGDESTYSKSQTFTSSDGEYGWSREINWSQQEPGAYQSFSYGPCNYISKDWVK